ncbi:hypothetical protein [Acinetobacter junii]|uniref:hypothetical protein n=1 Tax=Acinetobacter junii TaxID=40215 RepID=UPI00124DF170|nr:hypothetical protein [Acinetobacter junii]
MKLKPLVIMMAMLPVGLLPTSTATFASDLTLYKGNTTGKTSILLMLDTSGSMGISSLVLPKTNAYGSPGDVTTPLCDRVDVKEYKNDYKDSTAVNFKEWAYNLRDTNPASPTYNKTSIYKTVTIGGTTIPYYVRGCTSGGVTQYDRLSRLKDAILPLLADTSSAGLSNSVVMGLGQFSSKTGLTIGNVTTKLVDGHSGRILVKNAALDNAQRIKIAQGLAAIKSIDTTTDEDGTANANFKISSQTYPDVTKAASGTPTVHAYAEAAAYMMGTNTGGAATTATKISYIYDGYMLKQKGSEQVYLLCATAGGGTTTALGAIVKQCPSNWPEWDDTNKTVTGTLVLKPYNGSCTQESGANAGWCKVSYNDFKTAVGGGMVSLWDAYKKLPVGWRFDGWVKVPSEPLDIEPVVGTVWGYPDNINGLVSYRTNPFSLDGTNDNLVGGFAYSATETKSGSNYIAGGSTNSCDGNGIYFLTDGAPNSTKDTMAQTIINRSLSDNATYKFAAKPTGGLVSPTLKSDLFAGETGGWEYIGEFAKKLRNRTDSSNTQKNPADMNIKTAVVGFGASFAGLTKNADGTYNCASAPNDDAKNACLWGSKDYGDGGFYYAENSNDIKNSIINFVNNVKVTFPPSSLGSISVPRDPLDQTRMMSTGFFPMILPQEATNVMTWAGNLKKYKVLGGTLKDSGNNAIYTTTNNQQVINSSAKDLWSIAAITDDHSSVKSGGAWNKIPVPSTLNIENEPSKSDSIRNVFTIDGTTLKKVTKANLATDYSGTDPAALSNTTNITVAQRYNLLNYLGYQASAGTTLTTSDVNGLATTPTSPYRYLGGVIHSIPLVVTQSATLNSDGNGVGSRKEYVVYGSMEGGLHVVDASNGEEQSVFVPKETLDNDSGKTLANWEFKTTGTMSYGVDAPWTADNTFKVKTTTSGTASTTKYEATKINIYGGLRMGGAALYGLNIKTPTSPSLLFRITPSTTGFSRMGQIWSKPTLADIRVKGVRKRVLIFGGGYDAAVYERNNATFTEPTTATQGNAIYIVDASNGTLLWMASSDTTGVADSYKKITSSEMLYSVVGQPVVRDYDADGLADMIYFADLGGQMFRVDLNNAAQTSTATNINVGVRVKRIADLREGSGSNLFVPRFYDRLTTAIFGDGTNRFVLVSAGSGNRSFPLEASNTHNKVYGILDYDAAVKGIESTTYADSNFKAVATSNNILARGILGKTSTTISSWGTNGSISDDKAVAEMGPSGTKRGWKFDLSSVGDNSTQKYSKSFEESQLVSNDLYVNVYDSQASLNGIASGCGGGVQGLSTTHRICAPYADCAAYVKQDYQGILGPIMGLTTENSRTSGLVGAVAANQEACVGHCPDNKTSLTNQNLYSYSQARKIKPTRWYER